MEKFKDLNNFTNYNFTENCNINKYFHGNYNEFANYLDTLAKTTLNNFGYAPAFYLAMLDLVLNLIAHPGKQIELINDLAKKIMELQNVVSKLPFNHQEATELGQQFEDKRFKYAAWNNAPFNLYKIWFLLLENFYKQVIEIIPGFSEHHKLVNNFILQQLLNLICPINNPMTNPEIIAAIQNSQGKNLIQGFKNFQEDLARKMHNLPPVGTEEFSVGNNLAITPGKVIYRNDLIELIQYIPTTAEVYKEPVLIVPACIMKYYILDLSAKNSLVKYLVSQGHSVFIISWKNVTAADKHLGFDDYLNLGVMAAMNVIHDLMPNSLIQAAGYCLGGTMLAIAAAYMASQGDHRLKTITLLAAQVDFKLAGELLVFIDENQLSMLKANMDKVGYLDGMQMGSAFNLLHAQDLIWGKIVQDYLIGERKPLFDIMAWNADVTRLPAKMHFEYLEKLFLKNAFTEGEFLVNNKIVSLIDLNIPIFAVGTVADHVAPWKSVYKINLFTKTEVTFVLTTGGHNVGIVSEPNHPGRSYQVMLKNSNDHFMHHDLWKQTAPTKEGSWWIEWQNWLAQKSTEKITAPIVGDPNKGYKVLADAPGSYVLDK